MSKTVMTFVESVEKMRHYQKEYFKHKMRADLDQAKSLEAQVDAMTKDMKRIYGVKK